MKLLELTSIGVLLINRENWLCCDIAGLLISCCMLLCCMLRWNFLCQLTFLIFMILISVSTKREHSLECMQ